MEMTLRPATSGNRIRPRAFGPRLPGQAGAWRWPNWAARVAGRYGARGEAWDRLLATLRVIGPAQITVQQQVTWRNSLYQAQQWPLALTLHIALHTSTASNRSAARQAAAGLPSLPAVLVRAGSPGVLPNGTLPAEAAPRWITPMAARLTTPAPAAQTRGGQQPTLRTVLAASSTAPLSPGAAPMPMSLPPVPRVVQQPPHVAPAPPPATAAPALPSALHYWGDPSPAASPGVNIAQLTDQVIRTIDQRVVAARERLGKS